MDYQGFAWGLFVLFGLVPGLVGAGLAAAFAWRRGASPIRIAMTALLGSAIAVVIAFVLVLLFLRY